MAIRFSNLAAIAAADAVIDLLAAGGRVEMYTGPQPATAETAITTQVLLATFDFPVPAYNPAAVVPGQNYVAGVSDAIAAAIPVATGIAVWGRVFDTADNVIFDGNAGTSASSAFLRLSTTSITVGVGISVILSEYRQPTL